MASPSKRRLAPYDMLSPGFEAVYTDETSNEAIPPTGWPVSRSTDDSGCVIETWSVWTWQSDPSGWDDEIRQINAMQERLALLDDETRQIRAHIGSLVLCEAGIPATIDDLLAAIGRGRFLEPPLHDGCWCCGMWWQCRGTQHGQPDAMAAIERILVGYLGGATAEGSAERFPDAEGFIRRAYSWLPPVGELSQVQRLMIERMLLPFAYLAGREADYGVAHADCFGGGGRGTQLDGEISALAGLPPIYPEYTREFASTLQTIDDPHQRELYAICAAIAHGLHGLSDCHHSAFRWIERWVHDIGMLSLGIPERRAGVERRRLAELLFGYTLGLDKWLLGRSMQFLLMDLGYLDLGFDPKNEILRVYAYLGTDHTPVEEWLVACLWKSLSGAANPRGLVIQDELIDRARELGLSSREWMDGQLAGSA
jgi:hypothetical protein